MQIIVLGIIFAVFVGVGIHLWRVYAARRRFFADWCAFCAHMGIEISFSKSYIAGVIERYGESYGAHFRDVVSGYKRLLDEKLDVTRDAVDGLMWHRLRMDERAALVDFFVGLGRHGCGEEATKLDGSKMVADGLHQRAVGEVRTRASIYLKLCIIVGIGSVILLV